LSEVFAWQVRSPLLITRVCWRILLLCNYNFFFGFFFESSLSSLGGKSSLSSLFLCINDSSIGIGKFLLFFSDFNLHSSLWLFWWISRFCFLLDSSSLSSLLYVSGRLFVTWLRFSLDCFSSGNGSSLRSCNGICFSLSFCISFHLFDFQRLCLGFSGIFFGLSSKNSDLLI